MRLAASELLLRGKRLKVSGGKVATTILQYNAPPGATIALSPLKGEMSKQIFCFDREVILHLAFKMPSAFYFPSFFFLPRTIFVIMPRISAQAVPVIVTLPIARAMPPMPVIRITDVVKRFALSSRSTF